MVKRRTLGEGLSPEEEAFLNPSQPAAPDEEKAGETDKVMPKHQTPPAAEEPDRTYSRTPLFPSNMYFSMMVPNSGMIGLNTRVPADISMALLTASMQRKIQRITPFTQQDIVAQALGDWLKKEGFL